MTAIAAALTYPADDPRGQIDHVLALGPLRPVSSGCARALPLSDHRAMEVVMERV